MARRGFGQALNTINNSIPSHNQTATGPTFLTCTSTPRLGFYPYQSFFQSGPSTRAFSCGGSFLLQLSPTNFLFPPTNEMEKTVFNWEEPGLNQARFEALTKLFLLRSQCQKDTADEELETVDLREELRTDEAIKKWYLGKAFVDQLAKVVGDEKDKHRFAATSMVASKDSVTILVAQDCEFSQDDEKFLAQIQTLLRALAAGHSKGLSHPPLLLKTWTKVSTQITRIRPAWMNFGSKLPIDAVLRPLTNVMFRILSPHS